MLFCRGIAVPAASVENSAAEIRRNGLQVRTDGWRMLAHDLKPHLDRIWALPSITRADVEPDVEMPNWVCACADRSSALYYACKHNVTSEDNASLLITFEAELSDVIIDGRDFLYTIFQLGDPDRARPIARQLFGTAILRYVDRAWNTDQDDQRISICRLAVQDDNVIRAHASNAIAISGRSRTQFCNAFLVRLPITSDRIVTVEEIDAERATLPRASRGFSADGPTARRRNRFRVGIGAGIRTQLPVHGARLGMAPGPCSFRCVAAGPGEQPARNV